MPIPFRSTDPLEVLGTTTYLSIVAGERYGDRESGQQVYLGALFLMNARGEPLEFSYNRVASRHSWLWGEEGPRRHVERKLTASLLQACPRVPQLLLCLAAETGTALFEQDLQLQIPVARLAGPQDETTTTWYPAPPAPDSGAWHLWRHLQQFGLLWEPFDRTHRGLREVYGSGEHDG